MYIIIPLNQPLHVDKQYHMTKPVSYCYHHGHEPLSMIECSKKKCGTLFDIGRQCQLLLSIFTTTCVPFPSNIIPHYT